MGVSQVRRTDLRSQTGMPFLWATMALEEGSRAGVFAIKAEITDAWAWLLNRSQIG